MAEQRCLWERDAVLALLQDGEQGQAGCSGWERGALLRQQLSKAHCGAGKPKLSTTINSQHGETERVFIKFACHERLGLQTEEGLWQTGETG